MAGIDVSNLGSVLNMQGNPEPNELDNCQSMSIAISCSRSSKQSLVKKSFQENKKLFHIDHNRLFYVANDHQPPYDTVPCTVSA